ncbi:MAG: membrane protein insertase YidC, partial [Prevotellaceae bacterium]|nr:membrane protein insertase YidC [Prevotellaceae bacterium]
MDKNTVIGFLLIAVIVIGFGLLNRPSEEEIARQRKYNDSIALVQQARAEAEAAARAALEEQRNTVTETDSASVSGQLANAFGEFSAAATGEEKLITLENELIKLAISTKGGTVYSAELKNYRTHDSLPLILFEGEESRMNFTLITNGNLIVNTENMYFEPIADIKKDESGAQTLILRLNTTEKDAYIDFAYTLPTNDYMLAFGMKSNNMNRVMPLGTNYLEMEWDAKIRQQEKGRKFESQYSAIHYKYESDDMEKMSNAKNDSKKLSNRVKWIAFKDQFFSTILIANNAFTSASLMSTVEHETSPYLKSYASKMVMPFDPTGKEPSTFRVYYGPNQYKILKAYDNDVPKNLKLKLRDIVPLGWGIFGWISRMLIIPMFNFFGRFIGNYGIIILLMTIVIKIIIFPMTYKSYMSSAKMRVLKPEIDEINKR